MTTPPAGYRFVDAKDRQEEFFDVDRMAFGMASDPEVDALVPVTLDWDRAVGVEDADGRLAGVHASFPFTMPVPGASVRTSGLTWVGVRPDHRRRGLLQSMIATHFERSLSRGEPVSALFAAEAGIYGRFGYGSAADGVRLTLDRRAPLREVDGSSDLSVRLETLDAAAHGDVVDAVHRTAGSGRPGWIARDTEVLRARHLVDPPAWRHGGEPLRIATVRAPSATDPDVRGYALFRRTERWEDERPRSTVQIRELAAVDPAAAHRLWTFLLDLDLTATVETAALPVDDALTQLLVDPRSAVARLQDNLWVRLLDLPAALAARRYAAPVDVVLEVTDDRLPANAGRWRLRTTGTGTGTGTGTEVSNGVSTRVGTDAGVAGAHAAEVEPTTAAPDVSLDVRDLGGAYLGGRSLAPLGTAGLAAEHTPGALLAASAAFRWPLAPLCSWGW